MSVWMSPHFPTVKPTANAYAMILAGQDNLYRTTMLAFPLKSLDVINNYKNCAIKIIPRWGC